MKRWILLSIALVAFWASVSAVNAQEKSNDSPRYIYCELAQVKGGRAITVCVNFGQYLDANPLANNIEILYDEKNNKSAFNSMIEAINYMSYLGWEFIDIYPDDYDNLPTFRWILKCDVTGASEKEIEGFIKSMPFRKR